MMFVHPGWQGLGVASRLLRRVEEAACALGVHRIYTEASITARPFFLRRGFHLLRSQVVEKRGERLDNFLMEKPISGNVLTADLR